MQHRAFVTGGRVQNDNSRPESGPVPSRRAFMAAAAATAVGLAVPGGWAAAAAGAETTGLIVHDGWVLRTTDLPRLARA